MREIKFRAWDKVNKCMDDEIFIFGTGEVYVSSEIKYDTPNIEIERTNDFILMQYTGLKDKNGVEIYEGDIVNICYTSGSGEHIHDCIYKANIGILGGLEFEYIGLLWISYGYNQIPLRMSLSEKYNSLDTVYSDKEGRRFLIARDNYHQNPKQNRQFPFNQENELSFCSRYFEVIGNIHETPELLEQAK